MSYQLVIQFSGISIEDFDRGITIENEIEDEIGDQHEVDGHDFGRGEMNIFVLTEDPSGAFGMIRPIIERNGLLPTSRVAFRDVDSEEFTVLWPEDLFEFSVL